MSAGLRVLQAARTAGITVELEGEFLSLQADVPPDGDLLDLLCRHKAEIVELLRLQQAGTRAAPVVTTPGDGVEGIQPEPLDTGCAGPAKAPIDQPCAERRGVIRRYGGRFEHYCTMCGAWGAFGYDADTSRPRWYCNEHRPQPDGNGPPDIILTAEQRAAAQAITDAIRSGEHFALFGLAGTGKTTLAAHIAASRPGAYLCAPTGKAASVLNRKTGLDATTVHRAFYEYVNTIERRLVFRPAHPAGSLKGSVLFLDECSMVSRQVAADIFATGIIVIAIGDPGQLPPVDGDAFFTQASFTLREIQRQALESPIIRQAHRVRERGCYAADGDAVRVVDRLTATDALAADIILTGRRATRSRMNTLCRGALGIQSPLPRAGEPLVCLRNTPTYGLYNGAIYRASRDLGEGDKTIGISTDDGDVEVHAHFLVPGHEDDPVKLPPGGRTTAFAFGYALTVHKAQGSEFDKVLLVDEWFRSDRAQWLYTGITRAKERIILANSGSWGLR
jgi:exodeoxyribonuclease-5